MEPYIPPMTTPEEEARRAAFLEEARARREQGDGLVIAFTEEEAREARERAEERRREREAREREIYGRVLTTAEREEVREFGRPLTPEERIELLRLEAARESEREARDLRQEELKLERQRLDRAFELEKEELELERRRQDFIEDEHLIFPHSGFHPLVAPPLHRGEIELDGEVLKADDEVESEDGVRMRGGVRSDLQPAREQPSAVRSEAAVAPAQMEDEPERQE